MSEKVAWQRRQRREFAARHGYSQTSDYGTGKLRAAVLKRDDYRCVRCGMTDLDHRSRWRRPITIDHVNRDRSVNTMENLQTLCLRCHGRKDISPALIEPKLPRVKDEILRRREQGQTYQRIADDLGFSIAAVWKWLRRWREATR